MKKVLVFQHVANKILGTLNPSLKKSGLNIRYVNFDRNPDESPSIEKYHGLIVLGGHMGVYDSEQYTHIKVEMQLIEQALKKNIPILGICLGSQLLAQVLGAEVRKHSEKEIGWHDVHLTEAGKQDPLFKKFNQTEKLFQLHGDTFDMPKCVQHLAYSNVCSSQAFRYGDNAYGMQFHLEVDRQMITRWLENPQNKNDIMNAKGENSISKIESETELFIENSTLKSQHTFSEFIKLLGAGQNQLKLRSEHGQAIKK